MNYVYLFEPVCLCWLFCLQPSDRWSSGLKYWLKYIFLEILSSVLPADDAEEIS